MSASPAPVDTEGRWPPEDDPIPPPQPTGQPTSRRRLVTHVVLVDGLPADHWVEESADGTWQSQARRRGPLREVDPIPRHVRELAWLEAAVGGPERLAALDPVPLSPSPLDLATIPENQHGRVRAIEGQCHQVATTLFREPELGYACAHVLASVLELDPSLLQRSERDETVTGAVVWVGGQANGLIGPTGTVLARDLWAVLDVSSSTAARGASIIARLLGDRGVEPPSHWGPPHLRATGLPGALLASTRAVLLARRDAAWAARDAHDPGETTRPP